MLSTLSTGLNKSEEFIRTNATKIHVRDLTFNNNRKIILTEDTRIPHRENNIKCYPRCLTVGYFENYHTCHQTLNVWVYYINNTTKATTITPSLIDEVGFLPAVSMSLATLGIHLHYSKQTNGYQRVRFAFNNLLGISKIESNYHFAWIMELINRLNLGKTSQDKITIYQPQQATPPVDLLLGFTPPSQNSTGSLPINIVVGIKTVFPLFNGGINKITVSSDLLATSQYINNGHKTVTIVELQIGPSTNTQMNPIQVANSFNWK